VAARLIVFLAVLSALAAAAPASAQQPSSCVGDVESGAVKQEPGPLLRFGIGPLVQAGQVGPLPAAAVPERPDITHSALARLRPPGRPFVLRLNRFFWSDREEGIRRYLALAQRFTSSGYLVELQVRLRLGGAPCARPARPPRALRRSRRPPPPPRKRARAPRARGDPAQGRPPRRPLARAADLRSSTRLTSGIYGHQARSRSWRRTKWRIPPWR